MHPATGGILESSLYVEDVERSAQFYGRIFGFPVITNFGPRGLALQTGERQVLLLFRKGASVGTSSPHDGAGELHIAFSIGPDDLPRWEAWLAENGLAVEERTRWPRGGVS